MFKPIVKEKITILCSKILLYSVFFFSTELPSEQQFLALLQVVVLVTFSGELTEFSVSFLQWNYQGKYLTVLEEKLDFENIQVSHAAMVLKMNEFNPLLSNGISHPLQLDASIFNFRDVAWYFSSF